MKPRKDTQPFYTQLFNECDAMARHAFSSGLKIPSNVLYLLELFCIQDDKHDKSQDPGSLKAPKKPKSEMDCQTTIKQLGLLHTRLAKIVAPAKPRSILILYEEALVKKRWQFLSSIKLVRHFMLVALIFLLGWVCISLFGNVDGHVDWAKESGLSLLVEELFILFAAGIGAIFTILFQVNRFVVNGTYDPKYDSSYWTRFVLGIVAGMILALMVPIKATSNSTTLSTLTKPTLALLGGFSVTVVHRILNRLVAAIESLVQGDIRDIIETRVHAVQTRVETEQNTERMEIASKLLNLKTKVSDQGPNRNLEQAIDSILSDILPSGAGIADEDDERDD